MKQVSLFILLLLLGLIVPTFVSPVKSINGWSTPINLTNNSVDDWHQSVSADCSKIAYQSNQYHWEIFAVNSDGSGLHQVTSVSFEAWNPSISADGSKIAYSSYDDVEGDGEVYVINSDGSGLTTLTSNSISDGSPSISADGSKVAFLSYLGGVYQVYVVNSNGLGLHKVSGTTGNVNGFSISADGSKVAFGSNIDGDYEIFMVNSDGSGLTQLTSNSALDIDPSISADGSKIAFISNRDGDYEIFMVNSDGSGLTQLTSNSVLDFAPQISADGLKTGFLSELIGAAEVYVVNSDGSGLTQVTDNPGVNWDFSLSSDGSKIVFTSDMDGDREIYITSLGSSSTPVFIDDFTDFPAYPYNTPAYVQSGRYVGCGPTTGAMIFGYFQHHFGLSGLLKNPVAGVNEGLETAWELHYSYMGTGADGFGSVYNIKPGLENYAKDRGYNIKVMIHVSPQYNDPNDPAADNWLNVYGAYGYAWTNDGIFFVNPGGVWDINPDIFCDWAAPKLSAGIPIFLSVDSDNDGSGDHWVPCVGYDKANHLYYYYNTYDTTLHSAVIDYCQSPGAGAYAISLVRTVEYLPSTSALTIESAKTWYWTSLTYLYSVAKGDVDGDGKTEIVTSGTYNDGSRYNAQLCVWNGATLSLENVKTWYWTSDTLISSVAVGNVDSDGNMEIVTGGYYYDGTRRVAQLCVWDGATLALENVKTWYWTGDTGINSVAVGDVEGDSNNEIITGGSYWDGSRYNAQLCVWNGANLALENVKPWYWTSYTFINSVAVGNVDSDGNMEIVTGGTYWDGSRYNAQLCVWSGATLALENVKPWYWTSDTKIYSVAVSDVDGDSIVEIVTGGPYFDGSRVNAQLCVWSGATLALENVKPWYWTSDTDLNSVAVSDVDGDSIVEIVTGGLFNDGSRVNAQLCVWSGATLALENVKPWYWTDDTVISSVCVGDVDADGKTEIVTGGTYDDGTRYCAQLCVWVY